MPLAFDDIAPLFKRHGGTQYSGEPVTQTAHALQTAWLAEQAGADDELVTAALLHDLGHLLQDHGDTPTAHGIDDLHQFSALPFLRGLFGDRVLDAIRWHVDAKRYLCATRPHYRSALSADSQRSLVLQGGVFGAQEAQAFIGRPHAEEAVRLRLWDDQAKVEGLATPGLAHFLASRRGAACRSLRDRPECCGPGRSPTPSKIPPRCEPLDGTAPSGSAPSVPSHPTPSTIHSLCLPADFTYTAPTTMRSNMPARATAPTRPTRTRAADRPPARSPCSPRSWRRWAPSFPTWAGPRRPMPGC
ncbi:hypothetical protein AVHY2522_08000 [Acidovorax sp. SUPP2522]|nr:hypothetical protein AVHY2522_08000 [Acidovorax sp. SUPP2522]